MKYYDYLSDELSLETNRLIAEFMGFTFLPDGSVNVKCNNPVYLSNWDKLQFHCDWAWLYPVIHKIEILALGMGIVSGTPTLSQSMHGIDFCYKGCVLFIQEYNKENNYHKQNGGQRELNNN